MDFHYMFQTKVVMNGIKECLMGDCLLCGIKTLKVCLIENIRSTKKVQRQRYAKVVVEQKENGNDKKVTQLQYMDALTLELLQYLIPRLTYFVTHNFVAKWQGSKFTSIYKFEFFSHVNWNLFAHFKLDQFIVDSHNILLSG